MTDIAHGAARRTLPFTYGNLVVSDVVQVLEDIVGGGRRRPGQ
jgi:hypothetical protein